MTKLNLTVAAVAIVLGCMLATGSPHQARAGDVCVSVNGATRVQNGTATCSADSSSVAIAANGSSAIAGSGSTAIAVNGSSSAGYYDVRVVAVNGSTASANTDAVREGCSLIAVRGETASCP